MLCPAVGDNWRAGFARKDFNAVFKRNLILDSWEPLEVLKWKSDMIRDVFQKHNPGSSETDGLQRKGCGSCIRKGQLCGGHAGVFWGWASLLRRVCRHGGGRQPSSPGEH